jgi:predicted phage terminase large subunit-like protein
VQRELLDHIIGLNPELAGYQGAIPKVEASTPEDMRTAGDEIHLLELSLAEDSLTHFVQQAWHVVEPKTTYKDGWHIDSICEHLQAVTTGDIRRLLINIPPRHMKSLAVCVFWPAWEWIVQPETRFLFSSYAEQLSKRDSLKTRRLITSPWYLDRWGDNYTITSDQNEKMRFENNLGGYRVATSVGGIGTGEGGDRIVVDDPHNVKDGESDLRRKACLIWWDETMSSRINDPATSAKIIIMQRIHENDLSGHILEAERDYVHLCLPARYEGKNRVKTILPIDKKRKFKDPRKKKGDPLWAGHYDDKALTDLESEMTEYAVAGQLQQTPAPRGGGMFKTENFVVIGEFSRAHIKQSVRYWDKAGTLDGGAYSSGVLMHEMEPGYDWDYIIEDVQRGQWDYGKREKAIRQTAEIDGNQVPVYTEQEPGSSGKESAERTIKNLAGFTADRDPVSGSKETRAEPYSSQVNVGNVALVRSKLGTIDWTRPFIKEHEKFPVGKYKDQVDSASGAFNKLSKPQKRAGTWGR